jgi:3-deoxy-D-manno-octulosonic-acid transferase
LLLRIAMPFHPKAAAWVKGRKNLFSKLEKLRNQGPFVWIHCASLGEFEQGRPVMEAIRKHYPGHKLLLTFFSPSGYEHQKDYAGADFVTYLPMDGPRNAKRFIEIVQPSLVIFVKYEFWFYYLKKIQYRNIPLLLISASFRPSMSFFHWYGMLSRKMITRFNRIFVQDGESQQLLERIGIRDNVEIGGDTRFDRVISIADQTEPIESVHALLNHRRTIVLGSSWPADEQLWSFMQPWCQDRNILLVIAPHEVDDAHLTDLLKLFPKAQLFSALNSETAIESDVLIIDRIGLLSSLYRYGWINYVGGGLLNGGVHNVLEAAVYGRPVITGPHIEKYREAVELLNAGGLFALSGVETRKELQELLTGWWADPQITSTIGTAAKNYVRNKTGAVDRIMKYIQEKRLLTN